MEDAGLGIQDGPYRVGESLGEEHYGSWKRLRTRSVLARYLKSKGWEILQNHLRVVAVKGNRVLKVAISPNGLFQNERECRAYLEINGRRFREPNSNRLVTIRVPKIHRVHEGYKWILVSCYKVPRYSNAGHLYDILERRIGLADAHNENVFLQGSRLVVLDAGFYKPNPGYRRRSWPRSSLRKIA